VPRLDPTRVPAGARCCDALCGPARLLLAATPRGDLGGGSSAQQGLPAGPAASRVDPMRPGYELSSGVANGSFQLRPPQQLARPIAYVHPILRQTLAAALASRKQDLWSVFPNRPKTLKPDPTTVSSLPCV
jgi:hypothetical protein